MNRVLKRLGLSKPDAPPAPAAPVKAQQFHAVEIHCGSSPCAAVQALKAKRFLSRQRPPTLPLQQCDRLGSCTCRYLHHSDRRAKSRREADTGIWDTTKLEAADDRRSANGRRKAD
jgi:hypothetical protein